MLSLKSNFSETVLKESASLTYKIVVGSDNETATYSLGDNSDNLTFQYTIQAGDNDADGISIDQNNIIGTITDLAGNIASDVTINALTDNSSYKVDTTAPSVDNFTMSDTALKIGDNATVTLIFSEQICPVTDSCATGFNNSDIDVPDVTGTFTDTGSLSTLTTDDNVTWTGIFIPTDNIEDNTSVLTLGTGSVSYTHLTLPTILLV